jgi:uncharacterized membrane protein
MALFLPEEVVVMRLRTVLPYLLLLPPAVAVLALADRFPERMPIHWGLNGEPNGFVARSTLSLLGPLIFLALLLLFIDGVVGLGSRTGPPATTAAVQRLLEPIRWVVALCGFPAAFASLWGPTPVLVWAGVTVLVVIVQVARAPRLAPNAASDWQGGLVYSNAADPRLIVPKRSGLGWTFNFAKPSAWILLAALLIGPLAAVFLVGQQIQRGRASQSSGTSRSP